MSDLAATARAVAEGTPFITAHDPEGFSINYEVLAQAILNALQAVHEADAQAIRHIAFLYGNDKWRERAALNEAADHLAGLGKMVKPT